MRCHNSVHMTFSAVVVFVSVLATRPLAIDFLDLTTENTTAAPERSIKEEHHSSNTEDSGLVNENAIVVDGFCKTWIGTVVEENSTWEEHRCRKCRCDAELGTVCQEPKCQIAFHPLLESNCEAWSADGCCCVRTACVHEGEHYEEDDWFPLTPTDPCTLCKCDPSEGLPHCMQTSCPQPLCVDAVQIHGECCAVCLNGLNCDIPPLPLPEEETLDNTPLPVSSMRVVTSISYPILAWNCTCNDPGKFADCIMYRELTDEETNTTTSQRTSVNP